MRQEQGQAAVTPPLGLAGGQELVNDDLRTVGKIAKLSFPDDQGFGRGSGIAVFEGHDGFFGQQRINDRDIHVGIDIGQRQQGFAIFLVMQHGMAMEKRTAA